MKFKVIFDLILDRIFRNRIQMFSLSFLSVFLGTMMMVIFAPDILMTIGCIFFTVGFLAFFWTITTTFNLRK